MRFRQHLATTACALALTLVGDAQTAPPSSQAPTVLELKGGAGGLITFRISAPQATDIRVMVDTMAASAAKPLTRDDRGEWSGVLGPLPADVYAAGCIIDGTFRAVGYVHLAGSPPEAWDPRPVPHGTIHQQWYDSKSLGMLRSIYIYTPPDYDRTRNTTYPVLYLLHGGGGMEGSWTLDGLAHVILDNLIADGRIKPMVVVMPFGHPEPSPRIGATPTFRARDMGAFSRDLFEDIAPLVERGYRVRRDADQRAIAGLSMGGNQARQIGLARLDYFHYVAAMSGTMGVRGGAVNAATIEDTFVDVLTDPVATNGTLRLLWQGVGSDETNLVAQHRIFAQVFDARGVKHTLVTIPGGHTWHVWRRNLRDLAPLLFK